MPFTEYADFDELGTGNLLREKGASKEEWGSRTSGQPDSVRALAEEIDKLRALMVDLASQNNHLLTSEEVVRISRRLDAKLNEYMELIEQFKKDRER